MFAGIDTAVVIVPLTDPGSERGCIFCIPPDDACSSHCPSVQDPTKSVTYARKYCVSLRGKATDIKSVRRAYTDSHGSPYLSFWLLLRLSGCRW